MKFHPAYLVPVACIILLVCAITFVVKIVEWAPDTTITRKTDPCYTVPDSLKQDHRDFVLACIHNGNPRSDEEPEDLIVQCEASATRMFGDIHDPDRLGQWVHSSVKLCPGGRP